MIRPAVASDEEELTQIDHESAGFVIEGTLRGEFILDGELVDDVLMARSLS